MLDNRRLILTLNLEEDFTRIWLKGSLFISGCTLLFSKCTPCYSPEVDSPLVPCWVTFKKLTTMLFHAEALFEIYKLVGNPLRMDQATAHRSILAKGRVCVEVDANVPPPKSTVVEAGGVSHYVDVIYDEYPSNCSFCSKLGHDLLVCCHKNPSLRTWTKKNSDGDNVQVTEGHFSAYRGKGKAMNLDKGLSSCQSQEEKWQGKSFL